MAVGAYTDKTLILYVTHAHVNHRIIKSGVGAYSGEYGIHHDDNRDDNLAKQAAQSRHCEIARMEISVQPCGPSDVTNLLRAKG